MKNLLTRAENLREKWIEHRRCLHKNAEVGFDLPNTLAYVEKTLLSLGYQPQKCGKAGVVVTIGNPKNKPIILLRADMDALPIKEQSGEPFACRSGSMHACGHDLHTTMLLGVAELLKGKEKVLKGCVKLLFQPAEETLEGAADCLKNGLLKGEKPDCGIMLHVLTALPIKTGTAIVSSGGVSAPAADFFKITLTGKGCHGSAPWEGVDALSIGAYILLSLQTLVAREVPAGTGTVLTVGSLQAGQVANVIADTGELRGTLRTFDEEVRLRLKRRIKEIVYTQAKAFGGRAKTEFFSGCPTLVNDETVSNFVYRTARELLGEGRVFTSVETAKSEVGKRSGGSEDFAYISHEIPSVMIGLTAGERDKGYVYPLHHPKARFDEDVLPVGAALLTALALEGCGEKGKKGNKKDRLAVANLPL